MVSNSFFATQDEAAHATLARARRRATTTQVTHQCQTCQFAHVVSIPTVSAS